MYHKYKLYFAIRVYRKGIGPQKSGKFTNLGLQDILKSSDERRGEEVPGKENMLNGFGEQVSLDCSREWNLSMQLSTLIKSTIIGAKAWLNVKNNNNNK